MTPEERAHLAQRICNVPYSPQAPHPAQAKFLLDFSREALFGGAAGGGKSSAILMAALQFVEVPGYAAIIFRKSYADLSQPGALMDRADDWLRGKGPHWDQTTHTWTFPSGATLTFAYLERENDRLRYQGAEYQFIGFDELTQQRERDYRYLFSRLRRTITNPNLAKVPLRMRATTNPGGPGHEWVYYRFIRRWEEWRRGERKNLRRGFYPSFLADNPSLDMDEYLLSLQELDPVTRQQLLKGDWQIRPDGRMFHRTWWKKWSGTYLHTFPEVRYWDLAATDPAPGKDPDYTVGAKVMRLPGNQYLIRDIVRIRANPAKVEQTIRNTAVRDGKRCYIYIEQEPGASGKWLIHHYRVDVFGGRFPCYGNLASGSKVIRAQPIASLADASAIFYEEGEWVPAFMDEFDIFPDGTHDDQVDGVCGAISILAKKGSRIWKGGGLNKDLGQENPWRMGETG